MLKLRAIPQITNFITFNELLYGREAEAVVDADYLISVLPAEKEAGNHPLVLTFAEPSTRLPPGTPVIVFLHEEYGCYTQREYVAEQSQREKTRLLAEEAVRAWDEEMKQVSLKRREAAAVFQQRLVLPVAWCAGIKTSLGTGPHVPQNTGTYHVYLYGPLESGRLTRYKGDFLCTSLTGSNGRALGEPAASIKDGYGPAYMPEVNCVACLRIAQRFLE